MKKELRRSRPHSRTGEEIDSGRRRVVAGLAAASGTAMLAGCASGPSPEREVSREVMCMGRLADLKCVIKKGTLGQHEVEQCVYDALSITVCNPT